MIFAFPVAVVGVAALAALVAIYTFRARFRRRPVSSLMLWRQTARPRQGGAHRDRLRLPPLFYLELAVLAALVAAALGPHLRRPGMGCLTVVLDTSASMTASDGAGVSARERAARALRAELRGGRYGVVRLIAAAAAGPESRGTLPPERAAARVAAAACFEPAASLAAAVSRAAELSAAEDDILVLTDRPPAAGFALRPGLRWIACGTPAANAAITLAERSWRADGSEALLIRVAAFGEAAARAAVRVASAAGGAPLFEGTVKTDGDGDGRLVLDLPPGTPAVSVTLPPDALAADNEAVLLPEAPRPVAVAVRVADAGLRRAAERALAATGRVRFDAEAPHLVFADRPQAGADAPWQVVFTAPAAPRLLRGPYLADRAHPVLEGVSFDGVVWSAGTNTLPGRVLLFAGEAPLISWDAPPRRAPVLRLVTAGAGDALFRTTAWPALVWNVVQACAEAQPGVTARNLRLGVPARFAVGRGADEALFETPDGARTLRAHAGVVVWAPPRPGLYRLRLSGGADDPFAVNLFAPGESDLRGCGSGRWEGARDEARLRRTHRAIAWICGLAALLLAGMHHMVIRTPNA